MRKCCIALGVLMALAFQTNAAQFDDRAVLNQRIGGGSPLDDPSSVRVAGSNGVKWNADLSCGDMSLNAELMGSFNSGAFKELQASLMGQLMGALNPLSLAGMVLQRANPDVYDAIMNGNGLATDAFNQNLASCQQMQQEILNRMPAGSIKQLSIGEEYSSAIKEHANKKYQLKNLILTDKGGSSYDDGSKGIPFGGENRGQTGKPIEVTKHATYAGFNALAGRSATDTSALSTAQAKDLGMSSAFKSPAAANNFITEVVGETKLYTSSDEEPRTESAGIGAKAAYAKELDKVKTDLTSLSSQNIDTVTDAELSKASTSNITVSRDLLLAIRQIHPNERGAYVNSLAADLAMSRTYDKLMHSVRILDAGLRDNSVTNIETVRQETELKRERLLQEMDMLEREMRFKKELAGSSAIDIMKRANLENRDVIIRKSTTPLKVNSAN
jgi:integrating conjugative element protein (TIGR03755 family)